MEPVHFHKSALKTHRYTLYLLIPAILFFLVIFAYLLNISYSASSQIASTNEPNVLGEETKLDKK